MPAFRRILCVVGARPNFIKSAPVLAALKRSRRARTLLVHTGQHYDDEMSRIFFDALSLPTPDVHLRSGSGTHAEQTGRMLMALERVFRARRPELVVVFGDVNSTLAGALAAAKLHIPVAHVEAGLRSFNRRMPEEINRVVVDHLSDLLLCPTRRAVAQLRAEGLTRGVRWVGDPMYEMALKGLRVAERTSRILQRLGLGPGTYCLATLHRAENVDHEPTLRAVLRAFRRSGEPILLPLHPRTKRRMADYGLSARSLGRVRLIPPVSYFDMLMLESRAKAILTDSGGVQKEAFFFRVPCLTLRKETEWVDTVEAGWNRLVGTDPRAIGAALRRQRRRPGPWSMRRGGRRHPFGDAHAGEKIARMLLTSSEHLR